MMKTKLFLIVSCIAFTTLNAQRLGVRTVEKRKYTSFGINLNAMNYVGELDPGPSFISPSIRYTRPSFGLTITRRFKPALSYRGTFTYGRIKGDDYISADAQGKNLPRKLRNLNFRNDIIEVKGDLIIDFLAHGRRYEQRHEYVPYGFVGFALFHSDPYGQIPDGFPQAGKWIKLRPLKTEGVKYAQIQAAIPFGLGFRYKLAKSWDVAFEVGWRFTFTDYLDDVSRSYGDPLQMTEQSRMMAFKSAYVTSNDASYDNAVSIMDPLGNPILLPNGVPLKTLESYGGAYVSTDQNNGKIWKSDVMRGDKNKDWYIVTGFHITYIPPLKDPCPKLR